MRHEEIVRFLQEKYDQVQKKYAGEEAKTAEAFLEVMQSLEVCEYYRWHDIDIEGDPDRDEMYVVVIRTHDRKLIYDVSNYCEYEGGFDVSGVIAWFPFPPLD